MKINAKALAEKTNDSYSYDRYGSWNAVVSTILAMGYSEEETEAIVRSKWTRWAADGSDKPYGKVPAKAIKEFIETMPHDTRAEEVAQLVRETRFS